jgi:hypothetical protein
MSGGDNESFATATDRSAISNPETTQFRLEHHAPGIAYRIYRKKEAEPGFEFLPDPVAARMQALAQLRAKGCSCSGDRDLNNPFNHQRHLLYG